jgi:hypothetical protein
LEDDMVTGALWALASLAAAAQPAYRIRDAATCVVTVTAPQAASNEREHLSTFSATAIVSLNLETLIRRVEGPGTLFLKIFNPRGNLYQTLTLPYVAQAATSGTALAPGAGNEQVAGPVVSRRLVDYRVEARLPVAGTTIMTDALYGRWRAEPWLAGSTAPCGPGTAFVIVD